MTEAAAYAGYAPELSAAPSSFVIELTEFSGPLDLLLTLIREEQVDIYDIPIARIAEQFVLRIRTLQLNEAADYLEMAARLLRIKAQMLLPRTDGEEAWDDPRAELVRRLLEYQQMREIVDVLQPLPNEAVITKAKPSAFFGTQLAGMLTYLATRSWTPCWRLCTARIPRPGSRTASTSSTWSSPSWRPARSGDSESSFAWWTSEGRRRPNGPPSR